MKTGLITPCPNTGEDIYAKKRHIEAEYAEFCEAWDEWQHEPDNKKKLAHVVEELIDLATSCMTEAGDLEKESGIPALVDNTLLMVGAKTYIRGYHDKPMI
jgi:hypothetical protein